MPLLARSDLQFQYSWTAIAPDDSRMTGVPDSILLNRNEGYEVLPFINRIAAASKWADKSLGLKVERMIRNHLPGRVRSQKNVWQWIVDNWKAY